MVQQVNVFLMNDVSLNWLFTGAIIFMKVYYRFISLGFDSKERWFVFLRQA